MINKFAYPAEFIEKSGGRIFNPDWLLGSAGTPGSPGAYFARERPRSLRARRDHGGIAGRENDLQRWGAAGGWVSW